MRKIPDLTQWSKLSAAELNRAFAEVERLGHITAEYPLELLNGQNGINLRFVADQFWAVLTDSRAGTANSGCDGWRYAWSEVECIQGGQTQVRPGGRSGTLDADWSYEINGACVDVGTIVRLYPAWTGEWVFDQSSAISPSSSSSSSSSKSRSTSASNSGSGGSRSAGSTSTGSTSGGGGVTVVTDVSCSADGLAVKNGTLTGTVTINGQQYPVSFNVSGGA